MKTINCIFCSSTKYTGRFLLWTWELWEIGGGAGVVWKFLNFDIYPGQYNPLWLVFYIQRFNIMSKIKTYFRNWMKKDNTVRLSLISMDIEKFKAYSIQIKNKLKRLWK